MKRLVQLFCRWLRHSRLERRIVSKPWGISITYKCVRCGAQVFAREA